MKKILLILIIHCSFNVFSQDFYENTYAKERYSYSIDELKKWGFNNRFKYNKQDFTKYKDSTQIFSKIFYATVSLKEQVKINDILTDLSKLPNLINIKFESSSFLRENTKQREFPKKIKLLRRLETIILRGNPNWKLNELFTEFSKIKTLKSISFISFNDSIFLKKNFLKIKRLEGIKFQAGFGPKIPLNIHQLKNLKTFILQVDKYPNAKEEFAKIKDLDNLLVSIYEPEDNEHSSIINNFNSLKKLTINGNIASPKLLFSSIAKNHDLEILRIGNNNLIELPKEIGTLKKLTSFYSSNNKFSKELPNAFYNLTSLKKIEIQGSNLEVVSGKINNLTNLETLKLYYNKINTLPKSFNGLTNLKKLYLNHNQIKKLPIDIGKINLSYLSLDHNLIESIPISIFELTNLDTLKLEENYILELPEKTGNLKNLKYLNLELNNLTQLPRSFGKLKKLVYLNISRNMITHLPTSFGNLSELKILDADFCSLMKLPKSFGKLKKLQKLSFTNNNLQELSKNFGNLHNLKTLRLNNRRYYDYVFNRNHKKDTTITLKVQNNNITKLPVSFSNLSNLKFLELSLNQNINEKELFEILKKSKFEGYTIKLGSCNIKKLPVSGWDSIKAEKLDIRDNLISQIPKDIINSRYLKTLNLNRNNGINTYRGNKTQVDLLFVENGFIKEESLAKTDELVIAYAKTANRKISNKEYKNGVEYAEKALSINKILAHKYLYEDSYIKALYYNKKYQKSISYANIQIKKDTSQNIRFLNSIIPNFNYKSKSLLAIGDTIQAIKTMEIVSKKFSGNKWTEAGLLSKKINKNTISEKYFQESYKFYTDYLKNRPKSWGYHLSLIEAYIIGDNLELAQKHIKKIKQLNVNDKNYNSLIPYFEFIIKIVQEHDFTPDFMKLKNNLKINNVKLKNWSFELIEDWVLLNNLNKEKKLKLTKLNNLYQ